MKKGYLTYNKKLKQLSRNLRNNSTGSEVILWSQIKAGRLKGFKFNRQKPLGNYIADFYCKKLNLIIEIDGISHADKEEYDIFRQKELEKPGLRFLRFDDGEIKERLDYVVQKIMEYIDEFEKLSKSESS